jgi:hypothetical protein
MTISITRISNHRHLTFLCSAKHLDKTRQAMSFFSAGFARFHAVVTAATRRLDTSSNPTMCRRSFLPRKIEILEHLIQNCVTSFLQPSSVARKLLMRCRGQERTVMTFRPWPAFISTYTESRESDELGKLFILLARAKLESL